MAIATGAALGVGAGLAAIGAGTNYLAARKAAGVQARALRASQDLIRQGRAGALQQLQPYMDVGQGVLGQLTGLTLGKSYDPETGEFTNLTPQERLEMFQASPAYQFNLDQGLKALEASQAARGGLFSGRAGLEALQFGQNLANQEYGNQLTRLGTLLDVGASSSGQAANIIGNTSNQLAQYNTAAGFAKAQGATAPYLALQQFSSDIGSILGQQQGQAGSSVPALSSMMGGGAF